LGPGKTIEDSANRERDSWRHNEKVPHAGQILAHHHFSAARNHRDWLPFGELFAVFELE
jgi:hypothetical protein